MEHSVSLNLCVRALLCALVYNIFIVLLCVGECVCVYIYIYVIVLVCLLVCVDFFVRVRASVCVVGKCMLVCKFCKLVCVYIYVCVCGCVRVILYVYVGDRYMALVFAILCLWRMLYVNACSRVFVLG